MPLYYTLTQRKHPGKASTSAKWYATLQYRGTLTIDDMARHIACYHGRLYDEADIKHVANLFCWYVKEFLLEGYRLRLDDLGTLFLTCHSKGSTTKETFTHKNIQTLDLKLSSSESFKEMFTLRRSRCHRQNLRTK